MLVVLTWLAMTATAAEAHPRIVVIAPESIDAALIADVTRELRLAGYEVDNDSSHAASDDERHSELVSSAAAHSAVGGLLLAPSGDLISIEVWVSAGGAGKMRRKSLDAGDRRGIALHAVELMHAVLLDVGLTPPTPTPAFTGFDNPYAEQSATHHDPLAAIDALPQVTSSASAEARWYVGGGAGVASFGRLAATGNLLVGRRFGAHAFADIEGAAGLTAAEAQRDTARGSVRPWLARVAVGPYLALGAIDLVPFASAGIDIFAMRGTGPAPLVTAGVSKVRPAFGGGLRALHRFETGAWIGIAAEAGWVAPLGGLLGRDRALAIGPLTAAASLLAGLTLP